MSAYEYFEKRFGYGARAYSSMAFIAWHFSKMGFVVYLLALTISGMTAWNIYLVILVAGWVTVMYTLFGGLEAVIWTEVLQGIVKGVGVFIIIGIPLFFIACFGYFPYFWWKGGATPGMKVLGLRVVRAIDGGPIDGSMAAIRALVFYAESFFAGWLIGLLGFVWAAFEPRKRAWHDMAANTVVIHTN